MSAGGGPRPRMLVLDDRERIIRSAPGADRLREPCDVTFLDVPLADAGVATDDVEVLAG